VAILSFYAVIAGWTVGYFVKMATGAFAGSTPEQSTEMFAAFVADWRSAVGLLAAFLGLTALIVWRGVSSGIERVSKILMPLLFLLLIVLAVRAMTLSGAGEGLRFYLTPDFTKLTPQTFPTALGQAFFSLSLGMGAMITYGSYIRKQDNLVTSAGLVRRREPAPGQSRVNFPTRNCSPAFHERCPVSLGGIAVVFIEKKAVGDKDTRFEKFIPGRQFQPQLVLLRWK